MSIVDRRSTRATALGTLFVGLAVIMTRPRPGALRDNLGDPALLTALAAWPGHALTTAPTSLFEGPMFWPHAHTSAYSDLLLTQSAPYWLFYRLTGSWTAANAGVSLLFTVLAEVGAYLLAHRITGRRDAAVVAAVSFAFGAYAMSHLGSLPLTTIGLVALALVALLRTFERPKIWRGLVLALATAAVYYASLYYGALWLFLLAIVSAAVTAYRLVRRRPDAFALVLALTAAAVATAAAILPSMVVLLRVKREQGFAHAFTSEYDLFPLDLLRPTADSFVWRHVLNPPDVPSAHEHRFFPGGVALALGAAGFVWLGARLLRRRPIARPDRPSAAGDLAVVGAMGVIALVLAKGLSGIGPVSPWRLLHDHVPGLSSIRATSRLAVLALLAGSVLAAVGYAAIARRLFVSRRAAGLALAVVVVLMGVDLAAPFRWVPLDTSDATLAVYRELGRRPSGAVLELPIPRTQDPTWPYVEAPRLVYSTLDWHPRVNGYSGFIPRGYSDDVDVYAGFPDTRSLARLQDVRVRYVVLHIGVDNGQRALTEEQAAAILAALPAGAGADRLGRAVLIDLG